MGIWRGRAAAAAVGLGLCWALLAAAPAWGEPGSISGRVVEAEEIEGVGATEVCAEAAPDFTTKSCVESEGSGAYEILGLEPGKYRVHFQPPEGSRYIPQYYKHTVLAERARLLEVESGSVKSGIGAALEAAGWVTGKVTDLGGVGLTGIEVCVDDRLLPELVPQCAQTGLEGKYEIEHLPPGQYRATFSAAESRSIFPAESAEFLVEGYNETPNVDAQLELGSTLEGTIAEAGSATPLPGVRACALAPGSEAEVGCAVSGADGRYAIYGLHARSYVVGFSITRSEGGVPLEPDDGFVRQYYDGVGAFADATVIDASVPGVYGDLDARLQRGPEVFPRAAASPPPTPASPPSTQPPNAKPPRKLVCPKHFRKKLVKGKRRCVRIHPRHRHRRAQRP